MQEIYLVADRGLLTFDVLQQCFDFFNSNRIGFSALLGFFEISLERVLLDSQHFYVSPQFVACGLSDFSDFLSESFKLDVCFQNLLRKQR